MSESLLTPSQTVGPFLALGLTWPTAYLVVPEDTPGAVRISGVLRDGAGAVVPDGLIETWQADPDGRFASPEDPRGASSYPGFRGYSRAQTVQPANPPEGAVLHDGRHAEALRSGATRSPSRG